MKKKLLILLLVLSLLGGLLSGCGASLPAAPEAELVDLPVEEETGLSEETALPVEEAEPARTEEEPEETETVEEGETSEEAPTETEEPAQTEGPTEAEEPAETEEILTPAEPEEPAVTEDGSYTTPEDVALYIHTFGHLPGNYITKSEAQDLGWVSSRGNLWDVAPGMSIGGDRFGNYEGLLPKGNYRECDVNYAGGYRGGERIIFGTDGSIWYTDDHYESFTQLY